MTLRKFTWRGTADAAGDDTETRALPGRSPYLIYRIDVDDDPEATNTGSGDVSVEDELTTVLSPGDPSTQLETASDVAGDQAYRGVFAEGPITFTISAWDEDDVIDVTVFYESAGVRD